jgi:hypothetical protein
MYQKAKLFNDDVMAEMILAETDPRKIKTMGQDVTGFVQSDWNSQKESLVYQGLKYKFEQNKDCMEALMATGDKILVEASPYDRIWGIGLGAEDPRALDEHAWLGQNLLGKALTRLRNEFKKHKH